MPQRAERFDVDSIREQWDHTADAWDHAHRTRLDYYRIEVHGPALVAFTEQRADYALDARVVDQATEVLALVDKGNESRPALTVVTSAVMSSTMSGPDLLKGIGNFADLFGKQSGKTQEAESLKRSQPLL